MKPKKSLGQNFLQDKNILRKIVEAADLKPNDLVMEIGPGQGVLTEELAKYAKRVIAIEKDDYLAKNLAKNFQFSIFNFQSISNDQILNFQNKTAIVCGDILEINLPKLIEKNNFEKYKIIANIPYYITSPIIQLFLETKYPPAEMILMVQKEVAGRICAGPREMSILAVAVQYYAKAELLFDVPRAAFWPEPEVDSSVIKITYLPSPAMNTGRPLPKGEVEKERKRFFRVVRAGFSAKRKMLANNLASSLQLDKNFVEETFKKAGLDPKVRAQELSIADWKKLVELLN